MAKTLLNFSGAIARRVIDRGGSVVREHAHDWPVLSLYVMGSYRNDTALGSLEIGGPSALLYGAEAAHGNTVGPSGFEQIEIEFDPGWLGPSTTLPKSVVRCIGGAQAAAARALGRKCLANPAEDDFRAAVRGFIDRASDPEAPYRPGWVEEVRRRLARQPDRRISELARELRLHPAYLGVAYARATGERVSALLARWRVERAAHLLRESDEPLASIAAAAGFCDQSHMNRNFRGVLGRTPSQVRQEAGYMRPGHVPP